ncbi:MAG: DUF4280 domain-containing protein [Alphaproteobacteria bacterium]|nr:MAG: DUF4280 domain-containing protein [Alphaproteobacteria bacterium]
MGCVNCMNGKLMCSFGTAPGTLSVLPMNMVMVNNYPAANIMDHKPLMNVLPFGMCTSLANPAVAAATAAALGVLTPQPCIPAVSAPWIPAAPMIMIKGAPIANQMGKMMCNWAGVINPVYAGQAIVIAK